MTILAPGLVIFAVALCVTLLGQYLARMSSSRLLLATTVPTPAVSHV